MGEVSLEVTRRQAGGKGSEYLTARCGLEQQKTANTNDKSPNLADVVPRVGYHHNKVALFRTSPCETRLPCDLAGWSYMGV